MDSSSGIILPTPHNHSFRLQNFSIFHHWNKTRYLSNRVKYEHIIAIIIYDLGMQRGLYESLYGFWAAQEREEFFTSLLSSRFVGWASYAIRLVVLALVSHSILWDNIQLPIIASHCID